MAVLHTEIGALPCSSIYNPDAVLLEDSESGNYTVVTFVLENCKGIDVNTIQQWNGKTPLILASENGHLEIVQLLLEKNGTNVNKEEYDGRTALYFASCKGQVQVQQDYIFLTIGGAGHIFKMAQAHNTHMS